MESFHTLICSILEMGDYSDTKQALISHSKCLFLHLIVFQTSVLTTNSFHAQPDLWKVEFIPSKSVLQTIVQSLGLGPPQVKKGISEEALPVILEERFYFLLYVLDSLRAFNLPCDSSFYSSVLYVGARMGGLRRKLASLLAESRAAMMEATIGDLAAAIVESEEAKGKTVMGGLIWGKIKMP